MKKIMIAAALIGVVTIVGTQFASAHGGFGGGYGNGYRYCGNGYGRFDNQAYSETVRNNYDKFLDETKATRKEIFVKRSELNALIQQGNPDENKVAALTGELYDLNAELDTKADAVGIESGYMHGPGMMWNNGWGPGRHMMGW